MSEYKKPLPEITEVSREFWKAAKDHRLLLQRCKDCGKGVFYPKKFCPHCLSSNLRWIEAGGKGKVYSYSVSMSNVAPGFEDDVPYIVAVVDLEEGIRMLTNIVDCKPEQVRCDMPVEVVFEDVTKEISLPKFRPVTP